MNDTRRVKQRPVTGWIVGILSCFTLLSAFDRLGDSMSAVSPRELDESIVTTDGADLDNREEESDTEDTLFSYSQMTACLSLVLSIWAGCAASTLRLDAGWDRRDWLMFHASVGVLLILSTLFAVKDSFLPRVREPLCSILEGVILVAGFGVAFIGYKWWSRRIDKLNPESNIT